MKGKLVYVALDVATTPRDGQVLCNRWWTYHPEHGIAFYQMPQGRYKAPQCNANEEIARQVTEKCYPDHEIKYMEVVYVGHGDV